MKKIVFACLLLLTARYITACTTIESPAPPPPPEKVKVLGLSPEEQVRGMMNNIFMDNDRYVSDNNTGSGVPEFFKLYQDRQDPRVTIVACADSRFHTQSIDRTPENDIFLVRNIGNQLETTKGSVEYGVRHLHTPLLLFVGHTSCGAIKAAADPKVIPQLEKSIQRELKPLATAIKKQKAGKDVHEYTEENVHHQVTEALKEFAGLVKEGKLRVVGALYDFQNLKGQGFGKLILLNVDGKRDAESLKQFEEWARGASAAETSGQGSNVLSELDREIN